MDSQTLDPSNAPQIPAESQTLALTPEKTPEPKKRGRKRATAEKTNENEENGHVEGEEGKRKKSTPSATDVVSAERPSRERKVVERFSSMSATPKGVARAKVLCMQQGPGTKLREIPNVLFKVSKRKADDTLQALHTLLFGKKSTAHFLKKNILQFSGFVWTENEEKQRTRVKDRLDRLNKEKMYELCELLDIHAVKTSTKKEEVKSKLLEFLESPTVTRDVVLAEKVKKAKKKIKTRRSRTSSGEKSTVKRSKKQRKKKNEGDEEENEDGDVAETNEASIDDEDVHDSSDEGEHNASEQEDEDVKEEDKPVGSIEESVGKSTNDVDSSEIKQTPTKNASTKMSNTSTSKSAKKKPEGEDNSPKEKKRSSEGQNDKRSKVSRKKDTSEGNKSSGKAAKANKSTSVSTSKGSGAKSKKEKKKGPESDNPKSTSNQSAKVESKVSIKKQGKSKSSAASKAGPSNEELHAAVTDILKAVDFNTATLADILKQLGTHFKMDLVDRKSEIKLIIEDVISNMSDAEDDNEDGEEEDAKDSGNDDDFDADE